MRHLQSQSRWNRSRELTRIYTLDLPVELTSFLTDGQLRVLGVILDEMESYPDNKMRCNLTVPQIAKKARVCDRTVQRTLAILRRKEDKPPSSGQKEPTGEGLLRARYHTIKHHLNNPNLISIEDTSLFHWVVTRKSRKYKRQRQEKELKAGQRDLHPKNTSKVSKDSTSKNSYLSSIPQDVVGFGVSPGEPRESVTPLSPPLTEKINT